MNDITQLISNVPNSDIDTFLVHFSSLHMLPDVSYLVVAFLRRGISTIVVAHSPLI